MASWFSSLLGSSTPAQQNTPINTSSQPPKVNPRRRTSQQSPQFLAAAKAAREERAAAEEEENRQIKQSQLQSLQYQVDEAWKKYYHHEYITYNIHKRKGTPYEPFELKESARLKNEAIDTQRRLHNAMSSTRPMVLFNSAHYERYKSIIPDHLQPRNNRIPQSARWWGGRRKTRSHHNRRNKSRRHRK